MQYNITIREKDKGIQYIISYKDNLGKWKQKSKQGFSGKKEAKAAAQKAVDELKKKIELQSNIDSEFEGVTFKQFIEMFIEHQKLYKEGNTIKIFINAFNKFSSLNDLEIDKIRPIDIQKCVDGLVSSGLKGSTIKLYLTELHIAFNYAIKPLNIITANPASNIEIIGQKSKSQKIALSKKELADLLMKIENRKYYMISLIAAKCGLRLGEILGLTWDSIDEKNFIITVNKQWKRLKDGTYDFGELKSKNSNRKVPVPANVMTELEKYKKEFPINYNNRLFGYLYEPRVSDHLSKVYKKAGYDISVHELRHTYATTLIANGLDFKTVALLMGHDVKQTIETYSHVTDEMIENAANLINEIM
jgi:integrase